MKNKTVFGAGLSALAYVIGMSGGAAIQMTAPIADERFFGLKASRKYGRPSHHDKPESYYRRRNTPKCLRVAA